MRKKGIEEEIKKAILWYCRECGNIQLEELEWIEGFNVVECLRCKRKIKLIM